MNKVVVITGGAGVLGKAIAKGMAAEGYKLAIIDLSEEAAIDLANEIKRDGGKALGVKGDVLDKNSMIEARNFIFKELGKCDILINGAGGNHPKGTTSKPFFEEADLNREKESLEDNFQTYFDLSTEGIKFVFDLNFLGTLIPSQVFMKDMIGRKECSVLNISSMNAFTPLTKIPAYSGAKAAVSNFTQWLAVHFSKVGVRVNAIAPGFFLTEQNRTLLKQGNDELTERGKTIVEHTPMNRFGKPEDLLGAVKWLCGKEAQFVTGIVVPIDGGFSAFSGV